MAAGSAVGILGHGRLGMCEEIVVITKRQISGIGWFSLVLLATGLFWAGCIDDSMPQEMPVPSADNWDAPRKERVEPKPLPTPVGQQISPAPANAPAQPPAPAAPGDSG